ncbi:MAG: ABC transporter ATP-binding protein [Christensenellaceae bacterium]
MLKLLKKFTYVEWLFSAVILGLVVVAVWVDLSLVDYMAEITSLVQTPGTEMSQVWLVGGKMIACAIGSFACSAVIAIIVAKIATNFSARLRSDVFEKVQSFGMGEIGRFSTASLITRSTNDVQQIQMLIIMGLQVIIKAPVTAIWALCKISTKSWQWTFSMGVAIAILLFVILICVILALPKFKKIQYLTDNLNRVTRENLTGLSVVRAYNAEDYQQGKFDVANKDLRDTNLFANHVLVFLMPSIQLVMNGLTLAIYWVGAYLINNAGMPDKLNLFTDMVTFMQYAMQVVMSFMMLVMIFMLLPRASVSARRINEVLETNPKIKDGNYDGENSELIGDVEFKNVSFAYPDATENALHDISFKVRSGETVAFIGATGCGKSSVINLIPRFYDVTSGEVLVNGINVKEYTQSALRNKIGYISQKAVLFSGSLFSNVAYGDNGREEISENDVDTALKISQADEFIKNLEGGLNGYVAQGGNNFSGGQKQRISIARAVARKPEILIFDDSFSALDYKTDKKLRQALEENCKNSTRLIVAQRIGTIRDADKIIVLNEGKIVGMGKHDELMKNCEIYRQIAYSQLSKEELL